MTVSQVRRQSGSRMRQNAGAMRPHSGACGYEKWQQLGESNRAAREFRVLRRQSLDRRLPTAEDLAAAITAWEDPRNEARTTINGTGRVADARKKLHWTYPS